MNLIPEYLIYKDVPHWEIMARTGIDIPFQEASVGETTQPYEKTYREAKAKADAKAKKSRKDTSFDPRDAPYTLNPEGIVVTNKARRTMDKYMLKPHPYVKQTGNPDLSTIEQPSLVFQPLMTRFLPELLPPKRNRESISEY